MNGWNIYEITVSTRTQKLADFARLIRLVRPSHLPRCHRTQPTDPAKNFGLVRRYKREFVEVFQVPRSSRFRSLCPLSCMTSRLFDATMFPRCKRSITRKEGELFDRLPVLRGCLAGFRKWPLNIDPKAGS